MSIKAINMVTYWEITAEYLFYFLNKYFFIWPCIVVACGTFNRGVQTLCCSMCDPVPWPRVQPGPPSTGSLESQPRHHQGSPRGICVLEKTGSIYTLHSVSPIVNIIKVHLSLLINQYWHISQELNFILYSAVTFFLFKYPIQDTT